MVYVVIQEGGSSLELYVAAYDRKRDADRFRRSCCRAAYQTTPPVKLPRMTDEVLGVVLDAIARTLEALNDLEVWDG